MAAFIPPTKPVDVTYRLYALRLRCNRPISGLAASPDVSPVDVRIQLDADRPWPEPARQLQREIWYRSAGRPEDCDSVVTVWRLAGGGFYQICYEDGIEFLLDRAGTRIWSRWPPPWTLEDACTYLLGPVLGFVLRLRGITCLHASAIDMGDEAVAFVGRGGSGKSTAAAVFAERGYGLLSDDVVAIKDEGAVFLVQPAYPRLGLWPDSVDALFGSPDLLPRQTPNWDKRYLDLTTNGYRFQTEALPLKAIYLLGERDSDMRAPFVDGVPPRVGLIQLIENAYVNYLLDGPMRARDFDVLARIAALVPLRRVVPHAKPASLPKLRDVILDDLETLNHGPLASSVRDRRSQHRLP
jgi:hypothetical protein